MGRVLILLPFICCNDLRVLLIIVVCYCVSVLTIYAKTMALAISKLAILAGVHFVLHEAVAEADCFVEFSLVNHVKGGMLFWLPSILVNILSHLGSSTVEERMHLYPVLVSLAFHSVTKFDWSLSGRSDDLVSDNFVTCALPGYFVKKIALVKRENFYDGSVVPFMAPAIDVNWNPNAMCERT